MRSRQRIVASMETRFDPTVCNGDVFTQHVKKKKLKKIKRTTDGASNIRGCGLTEKQALLGVHENVNLRRGGLGHSDGQEAKKRTR